MERSEPTLVPEWLKNAGNSTSGSTASHSDDHPASRAARNKSSLNGNGHDFRQSSSSERTTSLYFRRSSSSNSSGNFRSHNSFGRNQRDKNWEKDAYDSRNHDNSFLGGRRHQNFLDPLGEPLLGKLGRDGLRRSQSMISGKRGDAWPKKSAADSGSGSVKISNGLFTKGGPVSGVSKASFERDFPSLGVDEKAVISDIGRVPSPGLSTAIQSLPIGTSASLAGEKWTSALAEVPMLVGSNGTASLSVLQAASSSSTSVALGSTTSLNMAEAVAQGPSRVQTTPQLSVGAQRLEELAIKQSRQLIPVTPLMPKALVLNSSDKPKSKVGSRQHSVSSSLPINHSPRGGPVKGDVSKASNVGKLHVLKPVREKNGVSPVVKDNLSPTGGSSVAASPPVSGSAVTKSPPNNAVLDRKPVLTLLEKRPTSQARSRNDFFDLVRKQSMANPASADSATANVSSDSDTGSSPSPSFSNKHAEMEVMRATSQPVEVPLSLSLNVDHLSEEKAGSTCNGDAHDVQKCVSNGKKHPSSDCIISEEEEAAFLRSMGWEENNDEEGLTEEEITAFYRDLTKYINSKSSPRILQLVQLLTPFDSQPEGIDEMSSSDDKLEP
ncbi:uncharacterized protein LOC131019384 isoform X1 [Salvia miltiorrhiza]|uniref:uncharacterized protein LOC131019384 isoform X1 n=2 Tax=Salvia miltiorrhiza TaxID=226208 RepID=UPI0025AD7A86|nr:uncharacterized protein LOC131019384 isoform X1 [Salvia miltiorrhiza]